MILKIQTDGKTYNCTPYKHTGKQWTYGRTGETQGKISSNGETRGVTELGTLMTWSINKMYWHALTQGISLIQLLKNI